MANCIGTITTRTGKKIGTFDADSAKIGDDVFEKAAAAIGQAELSDAINSTGVTYIKAGDQTHQDDVALRLMTAMNEFIPDDLHEDVYSNVANIVILNSEIEVGDQRVLGCYVRNKNPQQGDRKGTIYISGVDGFGLPRDHASVWNTLRHELVHAKNDEAIDMAQVSGDPNGLIKTINNLYETVKAKANDKLKNKDHSINTAITAIGRQGTRNNNPNEKVAYLFGSLEGIQFMMDNCKTEVKALAELLPGLPTPKDAKLAKPVEAQVEGNVQAKAMTEERRSELLNLGYDLGSQVFRGVITKEEANRRAVDATNSDEELGCVKSELDRYAVIPFETGADIITPDNMMPRVSWDNNGKRFTGVTEAQAFFNARKENMQDYWEMPEKITNDYQLYSIKAGDVIKASLIQTFPGNAAEYGLKGNKDGYLSIPMSMIATEFEANPTTDKAILAKREALLKDQAKYASYKKNYLVNGVFYDKESGKWAAYVMEDGKGKGAGKTFLTRVFLDVNSVESVRRLSDEYKTSYTRDDNGNLVARSKETSQNVETIKQDEASIKRADNMLNDITLAGTDFKAQLDNDNFFIGTYDKKKGQKIMGKFNQSVDLTGFYGEMGRFAKDAPSFSIVKFRKGDFKGYGIKIGNVPGGIVVRTADDVISISGESVTGVVIDYSENSEMRAQVYALQSVKDSSKFFVKGSKTSENANVFPFFRTDDDWKAEDKDPTKARQEMAARLKAGDLVQIAYHKDGKWQEFNAQVLYATSTRVAYITKSGHVGYVNPATHNNLPKRKVQIGGDWFFSEDGSTAYAKEGDSEIRAAYQFNNKGRLVEYVQSFKAEVQESWDNGNRKLQIDDAADIDGMISQTIGFTFGEIQTEEGAIHENRESLEAEWDFEYFNKEDKGEIIKAASNLIPGDIIVTQFTNQDGETKNAKHVFIGYNSQGTPMVAGQKLNNGSYFTSGVNSDSIVGVGRRTTPLAYIPGAGKNGKGIFINDFADKHEGAVEVSPGRPDDIAMMQDRLKHFIEGGARKAKLYDTEAEAKKIAEAMPGHGKDGRVYKATPKQGYANVTTGEVAYFVAPPSDTKTWSIVEGDVKYGIENTFMKQGKDGKEYKAFSKFMRNMDLDKGYLTVGTFGMNFEQVQSFVEKGQYVQVVWQEEGSKAKYFDAVVESSSPNKIKASFFTKNGNRIKKHPLFITPKSDKVKIAEVNMQRHKYKAVADIRKGMKPETKTKKSKSFAEAKKSHDSKQAIKRIAKRLSNTYGTPINVMDTHDFNELGKAIGQDLTGVRGLVYNGQVYINFDVASTADVLHEMTHLILPGIKATNPEVYNALLAKVQDHPMYKAVSEHYPELSGQDLAEEAFCTIFGEYFRSELMTQAEIDWAGNDIMTLSEDIPAILQETLGLGYIDISGSMLMNMKLEDVMRAFGSDLIMGRFQQLSNQGVKLQHSKQINALYQQLLDSGNLIRLC